MYAMRYGFVFPDDHDMTPIRRRVAEKGPLFDAYPGLVLKAFLIATPGGPGGGRNEYASFYVWRSPEAAQKFLTGNAFRALSRDLGRPRVSGWPVLDVALTGGRAPTVAVEDWAAVPPDEFLGHVAEQERAAQSEALERDGLDGRVVALDTDRWRVLRFGLWRDAAALPRADRRRKLYEVAHLSAPGARASDRVIDLALQVA